MSRFFSEKYKALAPYVPGEQPKDMRYIKLNTNESPFAPPKSVVKAVKEQAEKSNLYSDPTCSALVEKASQIFNVKKTQILPTNGSDEILNFAFIAIKTRLPFLRILRTGFIRCLPICTAFRIRRFL